jgi:hypothetical protein
MYQPLSIDFKTMGKQRQNVDVVRFLIGLKPEYESLFVCRFWVVRNSPLFLSLFLRFSALTFQIEVLN